MRKIHIMILLLLSMSVLFGFSQFEVEISFPEYQITQKDGHMLVEIPNCMQIGMEGEPLRPHFPINLVLPPGETLANVEVIIKETNQLPLMLPLLPKQPDRPLSWGNSEKGFIKNDNIYSNNIYRTNKIKTNVHHYRGVSILMGTLDPVTYYPQGGKIELAEKITLKISTKSSGLEPKLSRSQLKILENNVQNPSILSQYSYPSGQIENLLIITSNQFKSAFSMLIEHYKKYGIRSRVLSVEDIQLGDHPGRDLQEKIRNAIRDEYLNNGLDFVLLGGNSNIVPHRGLSCDVLSGGSWVSSDDIPADLYYAALDGNWDLNANSIFGEYLVDTGFDEADLLPELAIGRMPAETPSELLNMISKSIRYQTEPVIDELDKHTFFGEFLYSDPESWASDYLELLIGRKTDNGYSTQGLPDFLEIAKWYDEDSLDQWNKETVKSELANGTSFLHHDGHCNYTTMMKFNTSDINDSDFVTVNGIDHTMPVFYSHGCNCGGFDRYNCIASRIVTSPYITVGGVFNSRYGWFNEGQTEGPSIHLHREFENAIYGFGLDHFGWALSVSKISTAPWVTAQDQHEQNALRWNFYAQNILGDPAMRIFSNIPVEANVNFDISLLEIGYLLATVSMGSEPIDNAGLTVLNSSGDLIGHGKTNTSGYVEIALTDTIENGDSIKCYISGHNILLTDSTVAYVQSALTIPEEYVLLDNYPNPFNPNTTIEYEIHENMEVDIRLFDLRGKLVKALYNGSQPEGKYKINLDGSAMSSGVYICRLKANEYSVSKKVVLLK